jgi:hypothetical protein
MDGIITTIVEAAIKMLGISEWIAITPIENQVWIRDDRTQIGARWCLIENDGHFLIVKNGRHHPSKIDLSDPNSIKGLAVAIDDALMTTTLFINDEDQTSKLGS